MRNSREEPSANDQLVSNLRKQLEDLESRAQAEVSSRGDEIRKLRAELSKVREERDEWKREAMINSRMYDKLLDSFDKLFDRMEDAQRRVMDIASRPPQIIDHSDLVKSITEGLSLVLNGSPTMQAAATGQSAVQAEQTAMGVTSGEYASAPSLFVPEVESDEWMNGPTPTPGEWQVGTPSPLNTDQIPAHGVTDDGRVVRIDGQPMFQQGMGAPPPVGGVE